MREEESNLLITLQVLDDRKLFTRFTTELITSLLTLENEIPAVREYLDKNKARWQWVHQWLRMHAMDK